MLMPGPAKILVLEEEIAYAKSKLQPHATGHIYTAIHWMEQRKRELQTKYFDENLEQFYDN